MKNLFTAITLFVLTATANAFPTKVQLTQDPNFALTEGTSVTLFTNKGTLEFGMKSPLYNSFNTAKKGQCFIFETESESTTEFNKKMDKSLAVSVTKVNCK